MTWKSPTSQPRVGIHVSPTLAAGGLVGRSRVVPRTAVNVAAHCLIRTAGHCASLSRRAGLARSFLLLRLEGAQPAIYTCCSSGVILVVTGSTIDAQAGAGDGFEFPHGAGRARAAVRSRVAPAQKRFCKVEDKARRKSTTYHYPLLSLAGVRAASAPVAIATGPIHEHSCTYTLQVQLVLSLLV